jgi:hypothetical protein
MESVVSEDQVVRAMTVDPVVSVASAESGEE